MIINENTDIDSLAELIGPDATRYEARTLLSLILQWYDEEIDTDDIPDCDLLTLIEFSI